MSEYEWPEYDDLPQPRHDEEEEYEDNNRI